MPLWRYCTSCKTQLREEEPHGVSCRRCQLAVVIRERDEVKWAASLAAIAALKTGAEMLTEAIADVPCVYVGQCNSSRCLKHRLESIKDTLESIKDTLEGKRRNRLIPCPDDFDKKVGP